MLRELLGLREESRRSERMLKMAIDTMADGLFCMTRTIAW
jgi:hypothetical protein